MLGDSSFDDARRRARGAADYLGRHGPFAPSGHAVHAAI
jgi:fructose 1,6-bisphosphatase